MATEIRSYILETFGSLLSEDRRDHAILFIEAEIQRHIDAGKPSILGYLRASSCALNILMHHKFERTLAYVRHAALVPAIRSGNDGLRWYDEYRGYLAQIAIVALLTMGIGAGLSFCFNFGVTGALVVGAAFGIAMAIFATGKIAFQNGEFIVIAAICHLLPMALVLSGLPAVFAGLIFGGHAGWIVLAVGLSVWMAIGLSEFQVNWRKRSEV